MKKLLALAGASCIVALATVSTAAGNATSFTASTKFQLSLEVFVPCAAGGAGEIVDLDGTLHDLFHVTLDGNGGFHLKFHDQPQGISGTGQTTGAKYQATGVTQETFGAGKVGVTDTFVNNFKIIGQGPGNNFLVHENVHVTVNGNGTLTSFHDHFTVDCK